MEILGQEWYIQAVALTITLVALYFVATGIYARVKEYQPLFEAMLESIEQKHYS